MKLSNYIVLPLAAFPLCIATTTDELKYKKWDTHLSAINIRGNKFYNSDTGEQFFMKGIAYQQQVNKDDDMDGIKRYNDPLANPETCLRDIPFLSELGVNTIRVYHIDPQASHDICMKALSDAGIYVLIDLAEPHISIVRNNPSWDVEIWRRYRDVINSIHFYSNVLGFFAGNEVTNDETNTDASPFVKAAIRDIKDYIKAQGYRSIPVGYSTNDDTDTRLNLAKYFVCGDTRADFYGINMYEWCGYSSYGTSGYKDRTDEFTDYPIPVFFSEFGCNLVRPRPFTEVNALFGRKMSTVWSGGLVYMYFEEDNGYGVVNITANNSVQKLPDFDNLKKAFAKAVPAIIQKLDANVPNMEDHQNFGIKCPEKSHENKWLASDILPPTPDDEKCECLEEILPCHIEPLRNEIYENEYKSMFDYVCDKHNCSDIQGDGTAGEYGEFSDCKSNQKLSLMFSKIEFSKNSENERPNCPVKGDYAWLNEYVDPKSPTCKKILQNIVASSTTKPTEKNMNKPVSDGDQIINTELDPSASVANIIKSNYTKLILGFLVYKLVKSL